MQERTVTVGTVDLALIEAGAGGRPLLLVHGFTGAKEDFADHVDVLARRGWWVVAPDLRGHGSSAKPAEEGAYDFEVFVDDLVGLVGMLGWERFVLLGHSMGGMIAQHLALAQGDVLHGLVLMDTTHVSIDVGDPELIEAGIGLVRDGGMAAVKAVLDMAENDPLGSEAFERLVAEREGYQEFLDRKFLDSSPAMYAAMLGRMLDQADRLDALSGLSVPTLVLVGDQDQAFLAPSEAMAEAIDGARHVVIPDAGHSPQFENATAWLAAMTSFLDEVAGAQPGP